MNDTANIQNWWNEPPVQFCINCFCSLQGGEFKKACNYGVYYEVGTQGKFADWDLVEQVVNNHFTNTEAGK